MKNLNERSDGCVTAMVRTAIACLFAVHGLLFLAIAQYLIFAGGLGARRYLWLSGALGLLALSVQGFRRLWRQAPAHGLVSIPLVAIAPAGWFVLGYFLDAVFHLEAAQRKGVANFGVELFLVTAVAFLAAFTPSSGSRRRRVPLVLEQAALYLAMAVTGALIALVTPLLGGD